jgi:hypothetical protein
MKILSRTESSSLTKALLISKLVRIQARCRQSFSFALTMLPLAALTLLLGCGGDGPVTLRYRLTLEVLSGNTIHVGSGVIQISSWTSYDLETNGQKVHFSVFGEAVNVDLGNNYLLLALLRGPSGPNHGFKYGAEQLPFIAFQDRIAYTSNYLDQWRKLASMVGAKGALGLDQLPMLVVFDNPTDPKTIKLVNPEHVEETLGPGARILTATVEITDAPVTTGISKTLNWLDSGDPNRRFTMLRVFGQKNIDWEHPERNLTDYDFRRDLK